MGPHDAVGTTGRGPRWAPIAVSVLALLVLVVLGDLLLGGDAEVETRASAAVYVSADPG